MGNFNAFKALGFLQRLFDLCNFSNFSKNIFETSLLKSPRTVKLSYSEELKPIPLSIQCKWSAIKLVSRFY